MQEALVQKGINKAAALIGARLGAAGANKLRHLSRRSWVMAIVVGAVAYYAVYAQRKRP